MIQNGYVDKVDPT